MKKIIFSLLLISVLVFSLTVAALADDFTGPTWNVKYDGSSLKNDFSSNEMTEAMSGMLPGDSISFTVNMSTSAEGETDFWMNNKVIQSLLRKVGT